MAYDITQIPTGPADALYETDGTGTVSITASAGALTGSGTKFQTELEIGMTILIEGEELIVSAIASDTAATTSNAVAGHTAKPYSRMLNLGLTDGGIERTIETTTYISQTDQLGEVRETIENRKATYKIVLAQWNPDTLALAIPESLALIKGTGGNFLKRTSPSIGLDISGLGRRLYIVPVKGGVQTTDKRYIFVVWKAGPSSQTSTIQWVKGSDRKIEVMLRGWPDPTHNNEIDYVGDRSLLS